MRIGTYDPDDLKARQPRTFEEAGDVEIETRITFGRCWRCGQVFQGDAERVQAGKRVYHQRCVPPNQLAGSRPARPILSDGPFADHDGGALSDRVGARF